MNAPDEYGMSPVETLAHVAPRARPQQHPSFWQAWNERIFSHRPVLTRKRGRDIDPSDDGATHQFEQLRHIRIGAALLMPEDAPKAGLVTSHGYSCGRSLDEERARWQPLVDRGVAVLAIRVRGFPGSQIDTGDLTSYPWITHGLETVAVGPGRTIPADIPWSLSGAVADVVSACRALKDHIHAPIFLHGESFGGGLAVIAASQLTGRDDIARLAIGVPTFGDWPWRLDHRGRGPRGAGREIEQFLMDHADSEDRIITALRLFDTTLHARRVRCPVLCKLARRDDVVPAPSAAAVYNALGTGPGLKWRFVTRYGHFDGGIADVRRHALFEQALADFFDPDREPADAMRRWEPLLAHGGTKPEDQVV